MNDCIRWTGTIDSDGYGRLGGRLAHRVAYEKAVGEIPTGLELDHVCRNKACVNPAHLEPVSRMENMRRRYVVQTRCAHGHVLDGENTYRRPNGHRDCRACSRQRQQKHRRLAA